MNGISALIKELLLSCEDTRRLKSGRQPSPDNAGTMT